MIKKIETYTEYFIRRYLVWRFNNFTRSQLQYVRPLYLADNPCWWIRCHPDILFNICSVYSSAFNFLHPTLNKRIIFYDNGKFEIISFPIPVTAIFQVFGI